MAKSNGRRRASGIGVGCIVMILLSEDEREFLYWVLVKERQIAYEQGLYERVWIIDSLQRRLDAPAGHGISLALSGRARQIVHSSLVRQSRRRLPHPWAIVLTQKLSEQGG